MNIAELMALSEASGFYNGSATAVDEYPDLSLSECMVMLPSIVLESQNELIDQHRNYTDNVINTILEQASVGAMDESAVVALGEASLESVKTSIKNFFAKIKKMIEAIIAKLKTYIDRFFMKGSELWKKYGNDPDVKDTSKYNGEKFNGILYKDVSFKYEQYLDTNGAEKLIAEVYDGKVMPKAVESVINSGRSTDGDSKNDDHGPIDNAIEELTNVSKKERQAKMASALTGMDLGENWQTDFRDKVMEKHEFTYGSEGFDLKTIGEILSTPKDLANMKVRYEKLLKACQAYEAQLTKDFDGNAKGKEGLEAKAATYYNKFIGAVSDAYGAIMTVQRVHTDYLNGRANQARSMLAKLIGIAKKGSVKSTAKETFGKKKEEAEADNNDVGIDDDLMFEI